jgi:F0F1-type ATP synthase assembly protein I
MGRRTPGLLDLLALGVLNGAAVAVGLVLGWVVDSHAHTTPIFELVGLLLGVAGGIAATWARMKELLKQ